MPYIVAGLATGAIYALAGVGLVLTYKTSGIFNFGYGALATAGAYLFYWMYVDHGLDWKISFLVSVFLLGPLLGLLMERIARRLSLQRAAWKIVGTVGLILIMQGIGTIKYGTNPLPVPTYLPKGKETFRLGGVNVGYDQLFVVVISLLVVMAIFALLRFTRLGVAMRAVVDDADLLDLQATNPIAVRRVSWIIGSTLATLSGVLIVPFVGLESIVLTFLVVEAFGAAALGLFHSIPLTYLGGLVVGVISALSTKYVLDVTWLQGFPAGAPFLLLLVVLLVTPKRYLAPPGAVEARPHVEWHGPPLLRGGVGILVLALLALVPHVVGFRLPYWSVGLTQMIMLLSLGLLVRTGGLVSLCASTFGAIGAVAFSQLALDHHIPWVLALLLAALIVVPVGAIVAIPAIRLSGMFLALATLGFAIFVEKMFYARGFMFTTFNAGRRLPKPDGFTSPIRFYYVILAFLVLTVFVMELINRGRLGRILRGVGESPTAMSTLGLSTNVTRVIVFCASAFFAAISGVLYGSSVTYASSQDRYYTAFYSIVLLAILALAPFRDPWYAIFAGAASVIPAYISGHNTVNVLNVIFGFFAVMVALQGGPSPMPRRMQRFFERVGGAERSRQRAAARAQRSVSRHPVLPAPGRTHATGLEVDHLTVRFGGLLAVDDVSFNAPLGRITGLIGPNGAGKTTTFNACSGLNRPTRGRVLLHDRDVSSLSPSARARAGLGRTFQIMQLCESLTVHDNVSLGREATQAGARLVSQLAAGRSQNHIRAAAVADALELCGIADLAQTQAGALSSGQRRLVELARCLAGPFDMLLLDEPSAGLDRAETERFAGVLRHVVESRGCGILLVEHDMSLVLTVCSYVYVLDFGRLIYDGAREDIATSPIVQAAYLGSDSLMSLVDPVQ